MASPISNGTEGSETFNKFFDTWVTEQNTYLEELVKASDDRKARTPPQQNEQGDLIPLIHRVIKHYDFYYRTKSRWVEHDVLPMLNPSWTSNLEDAFLWIGGWRPSMAFHLLYSKSGLQLEAGLAELLRGVATGNLGDLSPNQLSQLDGLQARTVREKREISEKLAKQQQTVADASMVDLSHHVTELIRGNEITGQAAAGIDENRVKPTLARKEEGLVDILSKADDLRLSTLK